MIENNPKKDWLFNGKNDKENNINLNEKQIRFDDSSKKKPKRKRFNIVVKIKYKWHGFKNKLGRRRYRRITLPSGFILSFFVPFIIGILVLYFLLPGMTMFAGLVSPNITIQWLLIFLLLPVEVQSIVPWIAWIASGFVGGLISGRVLIPFISMYLLIWILLILFGDILQQFSILGGYGFNQFIAQILIINFVFAILAFGFGGWIGASIGGR